VIVDFLICIIRGLLVFRKTSCDHSQTRGTLLREWSSFFKISFYRLGTPSRFSSEVCEELSSVDSSMSLDNCLEKLSLNLMSWLMRRRSLKYRLAKCRNLMLLLLLLHEQHHRMHLELNVIKRFFLRRLQKGSISYRVCPHQGILKGAVSLYCWPPVWLVWNLD
jgi:hypothetical protein